MTIRITQYRCSWNKPSKNYINIAINIIQNVENVITDNPREFCAHI